MNPYVYSKGKRSQVNYPAPTPSLWPVIKAAFNGPMSSAMAFAMILFAASSVAGITAVAYAEIGGGTDILPLAHVASAHGYAQVLADTTTVPAASIIDDTALEGVAKASSVKLSAKPLNFDATLGRWDYSIMYGAPSLSGSGSITIGTFVIASSLTSSTGKVETGAILKPSMVYHVTFWLGQQAVGSLDIKTGKGKTPDTHNLSLTNPCKTPSSSTSTPSVVLSSGNTSSTIPSMFCLKTKDGKLICPRPPACGQLGQGQGRFGSSTSTPGNAQGHDDFPGGPPGGSASGTPGSMPPPPPFRN